MTPLNLETTVGRWVAERPQSSHVFEDLRIDYCCGGDMTLSQACAQRQLNPQEVLGQLDAAEDTTLDGGEANWIDAPLAALCDHIEQTHHAYLKSELPRLTELIQKVADVHGARHPELAEVWRAFSELRAELEPHMFKEERILFPAIRGLECSDATPAFPFGTLANPIRMMEHEHDNAGHALARIRRATHEFQLPDNACESYRAMYIGLQRLEQDMHQHVHKENNILFPRANALEQSRVGA